MNTMLSLKKIIALIGIFSLYFSNVGAQSFEIRSVNKGFGIIAVEMRATAGPSPSTQDVVTDMVFGLKWKSSYNIDLESVITTSYNIKKSGTRMLKDTFHFQAFFADNTPSAIPANWQLNNWIEIMTITNTKTSNTADTGSFLICERGFDITTDPNFGINLTDYSPDIAGLATGVVLPVTLLYFDVSNEKTSLLCKWKTTNEISNKGFDVQRSEDAVSFFSQGWVDSKGNKLTNDYEFSDGKAEYNKDYFYRLRQVDIDGRNSFSPIRKARLVGENLFRLSPNPAKDEIILTLPPKFKNNKCLVRLNDSKGAVVYRQDIQVNTKTIKTIVANLPGGNYFLTLESDGKIVFSERFVKL
jgi:hypothetical protein